MKLSLIIGLGFTIMLFVTSCIPLTYYISPEVLPLKERSTSIYLSRYIPQNDEDEINIMNIEHRIGLGRNTDIGIGMAINDVWTGSIMGDIKYQFNKPPIPSAFGLGFSYTGAATGFGIYGIYGIHPSLVAGYKNFDISITRNIIKPFGAIDSQSVSYSIFNFSYNIGKFSTEISLVNPLSKNDEKMLLLGFGINFGEIDE